MESNKDDDALYIEINNKIVRLFNERVGIEIDPEEIIRVGSTKREKDDFLISKVKEFFARVLAFWVKTVRELLDGETDPHRIEVLENVFKSGKEGVIAIMKTIDFDERDKFDIYYRASKLIEDKYVFPINQTKRYLESVLERAQKYYAEVAKELKEEDSSPVAFPMLEPILWLLNQNEWRPLWLEFRDIMKEAFAEEAPGEVRREALEGSFTRYMDFMCGAFPEGYGEKVAGITGDKFLMAEILWRMRSGYQEEVLKEKNEKRKLLKKKLKEKLKLKH